MNTEQHVFGWLSGLFACGAVELVVYALWSHALPFLIPGMIMLAMSTAFMWIAVD